MEIIEIDTANISYDENGASYVCTNPDCEYDDIKPSHNYCPNCGAKINWI